MILYEWDQTTLRMTSFLYDKTLVHVVEHGYTWEFFIFVQSGFIFWEIHLVGKSIFQYEIKFIPFLFNDYLNLFNSPN